VRSTSHAEIYLKLQSSGWSGFVCSSLTLSWFDLLANLH